MLFPFGVDFIYWETMSKFGMLILFPLYETHLNHSISEICQRISDKYKLRKTKKKKKKKEKEEKEKKKKKPQIKQQF